MNKSLTKEAPHETNGVAEFHGARFRQEFVFRRGDEDFLHKLHDKIRGEATIEESLRTVLQALKDREYVCPRVYRYRSSLDHCVLINAMDLPTEILNQDCFPIDLNPALQTLIRQEKMYYNSQAGSVPELRNGKYDPMNYITAEGIVGLPYTGNSQIYPRPIKGAIIVNFFPRKFAKLRRYNKRYDALNDRELLLLSRIADMVGDQVTRILELDTFRKQMLIDGLTGTYNQNTFHQTLEEQVRDVNKYRQQAVYLVLIDIDHFKRYNDVHGHLKGDRLLSSLGKLMSKYAPEKSLIKPYRTGGDEFGFIAVVPKEADLRETEKDISSWVHKFWEEVHQLPVPSGSERVTLSIGVAKALPGQYDTGDTFYHAIDKNGLYKAKESGRNQIVWS